jgi:hypothetical protein
VTDEIQYGHRAGPDGRYDRDVDDAWRPAGEVEWEELSEIPRDRKGRKQTRAKAALAMKIRGADYDEIAHDLNYATPGEARRAVEGLLAGLAEADGPAAWATQRNLHALRLEGLLASVFDKAIDDTDELHLSYNRRAVEIMDRISRLQGFDAPQRAVIYTPDAAEFDAVVTRVLEQSAVSQPHEGDIFELAEIEGEIVVEEGEFDDETPGD